MARRTTYHVTPRDDGNWAVTKAKAKRAWRTYEKKSDAVKAGKTIAKKQDLGQLVVHKQDGTIQHEFTYGADPRSKKG